MARNRARNRAQPIVGGSPGITEFRQYVNVAETQYGHEQLREYSTQFGFVQMSARILREAFLIYKSTTVGQQRITISDAQLIDRRLIGESGHCWWSAFDFAKKGTILITKDGRRVRITDTFGLTCMVEPAR